MKTTLSILTLIACLLHASSSLYASGKKQITLESLQKITGAELKEAKGKAGSNEFVVYSWPQNEYAEILFVFMPNQQEAKDEAMRLLPLIESGRTNGGKNIKINKSSVGEFNIMPQKILDDPHGFSMNDSDKTFIIFTRNSTVVVVDSKLNSNPNIPVEKIAREIDSILK